MNRAKKYSRSASGNRTLDVPLSRRKPQLLDQRGDQGGVCQEGERAFKALYLYSSLTAGADCTGMVTTCDVQRQGATRVLVKPRQTLFVHKVTFQFSGCPPEDEKSLFRFCGFL